MRLLTGLRRDEVASATQAGAGMVDAKVVQVDAADDLALLKANAEGGMKNEETFKPLPILPSKTIQLGSAVATIGFPDPGLQGFAQPFHLLKKNKIGEAM